MQELWEALSIELGAAFKNQYGDASGSVFEYWERELRDFSRDDIQRGFVKFKNSDSTFISLKIFRKLCKVSGEDLGIEEINKAMLKTIRGQWDELHPAFQAVARDYNLYQMRRVSADESMKMFKPLYDEVIKRIASGEEFQPVKMISKEAPKPVVGKLDPEKGKETLERLLKGLGSRNV